MVKGKKRTALQHTQKNNNFFDYSYNLAANFSDILFGVNHTIKAPSLLINPVIISRFFLNMLSTAMAATSFGSMFNFSPAFIAFFPISARSAKSVSLPPGETQVTDTFVFFNSCCSALEKLTTKDLLAA